MKWFMRFNKAMSVFGLLTSWFEDASEDGVLSADEIANAVAMLIRLMGYEDRIKVDPLLLEEGE